MTASISTLPHDGLRFTIFLLGGWLCGMIFFVFEQYTKAIIKGYRGLRAWYVTGIATWALLTEAALMLQVVGRAGEPDYWRLWLIVIGDMFGIAALGIMLYHLRRLPDKPGRRLEDKL